MKNCNMNTNADCTAVLKPISLTFQSFSGTNLPNMVGRTFTLWPKTCPEGKNTYYTSQPARSCSSWPYACPGEVKLVLWSFFSTDGSNADSTGRWRFSFKLPDRVTECCACLSEATDDDYRWECSEVCSGGQPLAPPGEVPYCAPKQNLEDTYNCFNAEKGTRENCLTVAEGCGCARELAYDLVVNYRSDEVPGDDCVEAPSGVVEFRAESGTGLGAVTISTHKIDECPYKCEDADCRSCLVEAECFDVTSGLCDAFPGSCWCGEE